MRIKFIGDIMDTQGKKLKKIIIDFLFKTLIVAIITLILLIIMKTNLKFKTAFYKYVYDTNISFTKFSNLYNKYFKDFKINLEKNNTETVSSDKLTYDSEEKYYDGVKLTVSSNYSVPVQESGIIVFIGEKENYGSTVIVQQINGIDMWYGNIDSSYNLYDYVKKGDILGMSDKCLYLLYKKDGTILNYEEYL